MKELKLTDEEKLNICRALKSLIWYFDKNMNLCSDKNEKMKKLHDKVFSSIDKDFLDKIGTPFATICIN